MAKKRKKAKRSKAQTLWKRIGWNSVPKDPLTEIVGAIKRVADHQELRGGLLANADAINKVADQLRSTALAVTRIADVLESVRRN